MSAIATQTERPRPMRTESGMASKLARKIDEKGRAVTRRALHTKIALGLVNDAMAGGKSKARANPGVLGGEERLENALQRRGAHPDPGVGDGQHAPDAPRFPRNVEVAPG